MSRKTTTSDHTHTPLAWLPHYYFILTRVRSLDGAQGDHSPLLFCSASNNRSYIAAFKAGYVGDCRQLQSVENFKAVWLRSGSSVDIRDACFSSVWKSSEIFSRIRSSLILLWFFSLFNERRARTPEGTLYWMLDIEAFKPFVSKDNNDPQAMPFQCPYELRIHWCRSREIMVALRCIWSKHNRSCFRRQRLRRRRNTSPLPKPEEEEEAELAESVIPILWWWTRRESLSRFLSASHTRKEISRSLRWKKDQSRRSCYLLPCLLRK